MDKPIRDIIIIPAENDTGCQSVLFEDGQPVEWLGRAENDNAADGSHSTGQSVWFEQDIVLAVVSRIVPALDCAFISLNQDSEGMLPLKLAPPGIRPGQRIIVQIKRLTAAGKGCQLTARPQLPGLWTVYRPYENRHLKRSKLYLMPEADRTELFNDELNGLDLLWRQMTQKINDAGSLPVLLHRFHDPMQIILRDWLNDRINSITIEGSELFHNFDELVKMHAPAWRPKLKLHVAGDGYNLAEIYGVGDLEQIVRRRTIWLKNGGCCVFDQTEAMLVVDINSAKAASGMKPDVLRHQTNMLAAGEIARQLRLREIKGLIVIDFIRTSDVRYKEELNQTLEELWQRDRAKINAAGFTKLGLYELSRSQKK
jgi:ribonuclease G